MKLSVVNIEHQGRQDQEVVTLKVEEDCNLKNYIVADATYTKEETLAGTFRHTFWFPALEVKKGDYVFIYTRTGVAGDRKNNLDTVSHLFFWNSDHAIWHDTEDAVLLFELEAYVVHQTRSYVSFV